MLELILQSAELNLPQTIANLEALKTELAPRLEKYNNLVVTEDSIKAAKADKSDLNRLKKTIDEQRKQIKKAYLEPYQILENQCKEVIALIDAPIQAIDKQLKAFDEAEKEEKLAKLKAAFIKLTPPVWCKFEKILPQKWANKTESIDKIKAEMQAEVLKIKAEFAEIQSLYRDKPYLIAVLNAYQKTMSRSDTLAYAATLDRQCEQKQAEQAQKAPENTSVSHASESSTVTPATAENATEPQKNGNSEKTLTGLLEITGTATQFKALKDFMVANGIKFKLTSK